MPIVEDRAKWIRDRLKEAQAAQQAWRDEARKCYNFVAGHQWASEDEAMLADAERPSVTFNRVGVLVDAVVGAQEQNRQEVAFYPREVGDAQKNEIITSAVQWVRQQCDADDEDSQAFRDSAICGLGVTETRMDYACETDGQVRIERVDPLEMYWDIRASRRNWADAKWLIREREMPREDVEEMFPDAADIIEMATTDDPVTASDFPLPLESEKPNDDYDDKQTSADPFARRRGTLRVIEAQWHEMVPVHEALNPETQQIETLSDDAFEELKPKLEAAGIPYRSIKQRRVMRAFVVGKQMIGEPEETPGGGKSFVYKGITGKYDRKIGAWYGIVRPMLDPQEWANKFFSQLMHMVNSNAKGGVMAESTAVDDWRDFEESYAAPDKVTRVADGALQHGRILPKVGAPFPAQSVEAMMEFAISSIRDVSGISQELLGLVERDQPGVLEHQRKQAALTILSNLFAAMAQYRRDQGRLLVDFIRLYIPPGTIMRVVQGDGSEKYVPVAFEDETMKYDVVVDEAPTSPNQRERTFAVLAQILPVLAKVGAMPPPEVLEYTPLPSSLIQKWMAQIRQQQANPQPDPAVAKAQAEIQAQAQKQAADIQAQQQRMQFDQQRQAAEFQHQVEMDNAKFNLERMKLDQQMQIAQQKAQNDQTIAYQRAASDQMLAREQTQADIEVKRETAEASTQIAAESAKAKAEQQRKANNGRA